MQSKYNKSFYSNLFDENIAMMIFRRIKHNVGAPHEQNKRAGAVDRLGDFVFKKDPAGSASITAHGASHESPQKKREKAVWEIWHEWRKSHPRYILKAFTVWRQYCGDILTIRKREQNISSLFTNVSRDASLLYMWTVDELRVSDENATGNQDYVVVKIGIAQDQRTKKKLLHRPFTEVQEIQKWRFSKQKTLQDRIVALVVGDGAHADERMIMREAGIQLGPAKVDRRESKTELDAMIERGGSGVSMENLLRKGNQTLIVKDGWRLFFAHSSNLNRTCVGPTEFTVMRRDAVDALRAAFWEKRAHITRDEILDICKDHPMPRAAKLRVFFESDPGTHGLVFLSG